MTSSNRLADAAKITPYTTHSIDRNGQQTLGSQDNAGHMRKVRPKKPRPRQERRLDDEPRFNVGSPRPRPQSASGRGRRPSRNNPRTGRRSDNDDLRIPDYPPPSFLEAISTPSIHPMTNVRPITAVSSNPASRSTTLSQVSPPPRNWESVQQRLDSIPQSMLVNPPDSDSPTDDSSLEAVADLDSAQTRWRNDRTFEPVLGVAVETGHPRKVTQISSPSLSSHDVSRATRGRPDYGILDSDHEVDIQLGTPPASAWSKKKHLASLRALSLSPLKTPQERSAGSPYSFARTGSQFFRSTTSLCKIPLSSSAPSSVGSESPANNRRLFNGKGKERVQDSPNIEPLDSWELVDSDQPEDSPIESPKSPKRFVFPRLIAVSSLHLAHDRDTPRSPRIHAVRTHDQPLPVLPAETKPSQGDKPTPSTSFLHRQLRRAPPQPHRLASFTPTSSPPVSPTTMSPSTYSSPKTFLSAVSTVLTKPSPPSQKNQGSTLSPTKPPFCRTDDSQATPTMAHPRFPLPASPSTSSRDYFPDSPLAATHDKKATHRGHAIYRLFVPSSRNKNTSAQDYTAPPSPSLNQSLECQTTNMASRWGSMSALGPRGTPPPLSIPDRVQVRPHHYPGRPLPPPPVLKIDTRVLSDVRQVENGPEDLLIDFEGDLCTNDDQSAASPVAPSSNHQFIPQGPLECASAGHRECSCLARPRRPPVHPPDPFLTPSSTSPDGLPTPLAADSTTSFELLTHGPGGHEKRTDRNTLPHNDTCIGRRSPAWDIDLPQWREDVMISTSLERSEHRRPLSAAIPCSPSISHGMSSSSSSLPEQVELERHRLTPEGETKLTLLGLTVDRCGICLSQFKGGDWAIVGEACQYVSHERCWIERSRTCPFCHLA